MADRYWVGGTASWDGTAGTKWALTSGGAGGQAVPTSADDVFFDAASGANTVTIAAGNTGAKSINCTGFTGTLAGSANITVSGSVTLVAGMTYTHTGTMTFNATGTLITAGKTFSGVTVNGSGITLTLGDALDTAIRTINVTQGSFNTANYNVTGGQLGSNNSLTRTISLGSSTLTLSSVDFTTSTNLTFNAGTSQINFTGTSVGNACGGVTFYNVAYTSTATNTHTIIGLATYNNLSITGPAAAGVRQVTFDSRQTINGTFSTTGTAGNRRVWFRSDTYGLARTFTVNATPSLTDADFRDLYIIGTAAPISGTRIGDLRGCSGITFSTPKTVYWNLAGAQNWSANGWATTSTGTPSTDNFPLAQDTATFTNAGSVTGTITMDAAIPYTGTVDMSGRTSAMTLNVGSAQTIYGNWTNGSGTTLIGASALTFSGRNTQTITSAGKSFSGAITVNTYGGTVELADSIALPAVSAINVVEGTFDTKNYNVSCGQFASTGSGIATINLGSSTITSASSSTLGFANVNLTLNAGTSQINFTSTTLSSGSFGGKTYNNISFTASISSGFFQFSGGATINNLTLAASASAGVTSYTFSSNMTITGTLTCAGASPVRRIFVRSDTLGTTRTLTVGTLSATDCDFRDITIAGAAAGSSPTRAGNCGGNTGITFPAAKTVYWNLAGTQNWSATAWAPGSGGTPDINNFPLAQDTAVFDNTGSVTGTITIDQAWNIGTFDASARTTAMTINFGSSTAFHKDIILGSGTTVTNPGSIVFYGSGTSTITSNGKSFTNGVNCNKINGTLTFTDAFTTDGVFSLTNGTIDVGPYNVTCLQYTNAGNTVNRLKMGSGTWIITGTFTCWDMSNTNAILYKETANIVLSNTSTSARTFSGGNLSYNKLTIGGTTGTSTLTISGNNQFTELASTKTVAHTIDLGATTQTFGKWTVTGTAGNVVTLSGSGTAHVIAGACTSGIDYLAMGSIGFSSSSPGEFYAGANSTATAAVAPVYLTAKPADSTRYWVGGTGNWSDTARWSTGSGGASGASVPRSHDDVVFDAASNATAYTATVNTVTGGIRMKSLTIAGPASGNVTLAGSVAIFIHNNVTLPATGLTRTYTGAITLSGSTTGRTLTTNGVALASAVTVNGVDCGWSLGSALDIGSNVFTITNGSFDTGNFNVTLARFASGTSGTANNNSRTLTLGSSTITASSEGFQANGVNLTLSAGTSQFNISAASPTFGIFGGDALTFRNVSFTSTSAGTVDLRGANSFNNLSFTGITSAGLKIISVTANQTVTGTLTFSAGTDATMRHFCQSNTIGTTRTITAAAVSMTDVDFRDITIAGAAAPASGTRIGDCKGNSGITFTAAANKYWNLAAGGNWGGAIGWATSSGGTPAINNFPLAQDTCFFEATGLNSGATVTINAGYNIGTIDMSARTTNTMTLTASADYQVHGNFINGTGTTLSGPTTVTFTGRGSQTITSAGKNFVGAPDINSPSGTVTLQDALTLPATNLSITRGTFSAASYNVTVSTGIVTSSNTNTRTVDIGSGTWTITSSGTVWNTGTSTNLTVTGTGTISLTSASAKTFAGGGIVYTNITLNQGGAGALTITGNNTFKDITNTYKATGATNITMGTTTQRVSQWTAAGEAGRLLTIQGSSASSPCTLVHTGTGTAANVDYLVITGVRAY